MCVAVAIAVAVADDGPVRRWLHSVCDSRTEVRVHRRIREGGAIRSNSSKGLCDMIASCRLWVCKQLTAQLLLLGYLRVVIGQEGVMCALPQICGW